MGARHQFSQQIFTKTMVLQVWKPENEPVGRHFVYTTRYVQFFMTLLIQLNDRANIDALVKRVRKKPADYFRFPALWEEICTGYLSVSLMLAKTKVYADNSEAASATVQHSHCT